MIGGQTARRFNQQLDFCTYADSFDQEFGIRRKWDCWVGLKKRKKCRLIIHESPPRGNYGAMNSITVSRRLTHVHVKTGENGSTTIIRVSGTR